jgi:hypothetical protein
LGGEYVLKSNQNLELDPRTVELISRVVSNTSTNLKRSINLLESNINIKNAQFLDIYFGVLFIKKVFEQYIEIIDLKTNRNLFVRASDSLKKISLFINVLLSNNDFIRDYAYSSVEEQKQIRDNVTLKYIDAILH